MTYLTLTSIYPYRFLRTAPIDANLELGFSEPVVAGAGDIAFYQGEQLVWTIDIHSPLVRFEGSKVVVDPPADYLHGAAYSIVVPAGVIKAANGDAVNSETSTSFQARTAVPQNLTGTPNRDMLEGGLGNDVIDGAAGDDEINGSDGNDVLRGGDGADVLQGDAGDDKLDGGNGDDVLADGSGNNTLSGGAGNDTLRLAAGGSSSADGGEGDDVLEGGAGHTLNGGMGDDKLSLSYGDAVATAYAQGGAGNDTITVLSGNGQLETVLSGGAGSERFTFSSWHAARGMQTITDYEPGKDQLSFPSVLYAYPNGNPFGAGYLRAEQLGADTLISIDADGAAGGDYAITPYLILKNIALQALGAADFDGYLAPDGGSIGWQLQGTSGSDQLTGSQLADVLSGAGGADRLYGRGGDDVLDGDDDDDAVSGQNGNDTVRGGAGADWLSGDAGDDMLDGGDGDDHLYESEGSNILHGGTGHDGIRVSGGINQVYGDAGVDFITVEFGTAMVDGGDGDDRIEVTGPRPDVTATGGAGRDRYVFSDRLESAVTITDFAAGKGGDILDPFTLFEIGHQPDVNLFLTGQLRLQQQGADTWLQVDKDGPSGAGAFQTVAVLRNTRTDVLTNDNFAQGIHPSGTPQGETLVGGAGPDRLFGGFQDDLLDGGGGDDWLIGEAGNDVLLGGAGNDELWDTAGANRLDGGDGIDHARLGLRDHYSMTRNGGEVRLQNTVTGEITTAINVERFDFGSTWTGTTTVAYDVDALGNAGQVYRLYQAAYDRKPDDWGMRFWLGNVDRGQTLKEVAQYFMASDEFKQLYGAQPSNADFVTRLYHNVLHREPEAGGYTYWMDLLKENRITQLELLNTFAESKENIENVAKIIGDHISYYVYDVPG